MASPNAIPQWRKASSAGRATLKHALKQLQQEDNQVIVTELRMLLKNLNLAADGCDKCEYLRYLTRLPPIQLVSRPSATSSSTETMPRDTTVLDTSIAKLRKPLITLSESPSHARGLQVQHPARKTRDGTILVQRDHDYMNLY